jgi:hypothetical protein
MLWVELFAESIEKPIMRGKFTLVFIFDTQKQIHENKLIIGPYLLLACFTLVGIDNCIFAI